VNEHSFLRDFIAALNTTSYKQDFVDYSRFGWMVGGYDLVLLSATGFPVASKDRNPDYNVDEGTGVPSSGSSAREEQLWLLLLGVGLASAVLVVLLACFYCRLRRQYADLEKDKGLPGSLKEMWQR
jgi:hypothetical protein